MTPFVPYLYGGAVERGAGLRIAVSRACWRYGSSGNAAEIETGSEAGLRHRDAVAHHAARRQARMSLAAG